MSSGVRMRTEFDFLPLPKWNSLGYAWSPLDPGRSIGGGVATAGGSRDWLGGWREVEHGSPDSWHRGWDGTNTSGQPGWSAAGSSYWRLHFFSVIELPGEAGDERTMTRLQGIHVETPGPDNHPAAGVCLGGTEID